MLNNLQQTEGGTADPSHIFIGTVVANDDPLQLERIKVSIPNLYASTDPALLPWVGKLDTGPIRSGPGFGSFGLVPRVGSLVYVQLQDGDAHYPVYFGSPQSTSFRLAEANVNYPNSYGWKDPAGNVFSVDTTPGSNTVSVTHASGASITIDNAGNITLTSPANLVLNAGGDVVLTAAGNFTATAAQIHLN